METASSSSLLQRGSPSQGLIWAFRSTGRTGLFPVNLVRSVLSRISASDIALLAEGEPSDDDHEMRLLLVYSLWVLRDAPEIQALINDDAFPASLLESLVLFAEERISARGQLSDNFVQTALPFLRAEKSVQIIFESSVVQADIRLAMHLLANLDARGVDDFLAHFPTAESALDYFVFFFSQLEEYDLRYFFVRNPDLFVSVTNLFHAYADDAAISDFLERYTTLFEELRALKDIARIFGGKSIKPGSGALAPLRSRRAICMIAELRRFPDPRAALDALNRMGVFLDDFERQIVQSYFKDRELWKHFPIDEQSEAVIAFQKARNSADESIFFPQSETSASHARSEPSSSMPEC